MKKILYSIFGVTTAVCLFIFIDWYGNGPNLFSKFLEHYLPHDIVVYLTYLMAGFVIPILVYFLYYKYSGNAQKAFNIGIWFGFALLISDEFLCKTIHIDIFQCKTTIIPSEVVALGVISGSVGIYLAHLWLLELNNNQ